jgi:hypothetical protein
MTFQDFAKFNDFSLIEKAVQAFFCAVDGGSFVAPKDDTDLTRESFEAGPDNIAFYTAFQALTFTKCRPRVFIGLSSVTRLAGAYAIDPNGNLREKSWRGSITFGMITKPDYSLHTQLRAQVLSIIQQVLPQISADNSLFTSTGINDLLDHYQVSEFWARNISTNIIPEDGNYQSTIPVEIAFSVNPTAWPAGMITV